MKERYAIGGETAETGGTEVIKIMAKTVKYNATAF